MSAKRPKKKALSKRVPAALSRWIKKQNPAFKAANAVRVKKLKNGGMNITPVRIVKVKRKNGSRRVKNVERGFYNATGFHPLRSSKDYDPDRAGDEY